MSSSRLLTTLGQPTEDGVFGEEVSTLIDSTESLVTRFEQTSLQN